MTLEKMGYHIGDIVRMSGEGNRGRIFEIVGFMPESYEEQGLPCPSYYQDFPHEFLCCQNMTDSMGHSMEGLNNGTLNGWWFDPREIAEYLYRAPLLHWKSETDMQLMFEEVI